MHAHPLDSTADLHAALLDLARLPTERLRPALADLLRRALDSGLVLDLLDPDALAAPPDPTAQPRLLFALCDDADGTTLYALPTTLEPPSLLHDLRALHGACIANASDTTAPRFGAFVRLLAALAAPNSSPRRLWRDLQAEIEHAGGPKAVGIEDAEALEPLIGRLAPFAAASAHALNAPLAGLLAFNKAM